MTKSRLEAFSDGVIAILITILVLELRPPATFTWNSILSIRTTMLCYVISFLFLAIYWVNHHHLLQPVRKISGAVLWANMHLLFWLSVVPVTTSWMAKSDFATPPTMLYGINLLMCGVAYFTLARIMIHTDGCDSPIARAVGRDFKGVASLILYAISIAVAPFAPAVSVAIFIGVGLMWIVPDKRIERFLADVGVE